MNRIFTNVLALSITLAVLAACSTTKSLERGYTSLFNGKDLSGWVGDKESYTANNGVIMVSPVEGHGGGNLLTEKEYSNFILRFEASSSFIISYFIFLKQKLDTFSKYSDCFILTFHHFFKI